GSAGPGARLLPDFRGGNRRTHRVRGAGEKPIPSVFTSGSQPTRRNMSMKLSSPIPFTAGAATLLLALTAACSSGGGSSGSGAHAPTVQSNTPVVNAVDVPINANMTATFS